MESIEGLLNPTSRLEVVIGGGCVGQEPLVAGEALEHVGLLGGVPHEERADLLLEALNHALKTRRENEV